jgi:hypothetical protein
MPRSTNQPNPAVYAFITSIKCGTNSKFGISASLPNTSSVTLTPTLFVSVTQMNISYIVVESVTNSTLYVQFGTIYTSGGSTVYPSVSGSFWGNTILIGLSSYNVTTDSSWYCYVGSSCSTLTNSTMLGAMFGVNVSCSSNSVIDASNSQAIVCQCVSGYYGSGSSCLACNIVCLNCTASSNTSCTACSSSNYRQLSSN